MARFRRKPRVIWLPPAATSRVTGNPAVLETESGLGNFTTDIVGGGYGDSVTAVTPVFSDLHTADFDSGGLAVVSLSDMYNSGYRLRRIVGKIYCGMLQDAGQTPSGGAAVVAATAGFIVLRTDQAGVPIDPNPNSYNVAMIKNWSDPWIWRRTWMLSNITIAANAPTSGNIIWAETNQQYGSVMDGPHVDARTARIVSAEERLFLVTTMTLLGQPTEQAGATSVRWYTDLRGVATLKNNLGNRRNASR